MSQQGDLLECGICHFGSHVDCVASPGLARLLNPFICSWCTVFPDREDRSDIATSSRHENGSQGSSTPPSSMRTRSSPTSATRSSGSGVSEYPSSLPQNSPTSLSSELIALFEEQPIEPGRTKFECREQFVVWAKGMYRKENAFGPIELKNSTNIVTVSCRNSRKGGDCPWVLKAEVDPIGYSSFDKPAYALLQRIACLQHSHKCLQLCEKRGTSTKPLSTKPKRKPSVDSTFSSIGSSPNGLSSPYSSLPPLPPLTPSSSSSSSASYSRGRRGSSSASLELDHASSSMDGLRLNNSSTALPYARLPSGFTMQSSANKYLGWSDGFV